MRKRKSEAPARAPRARSSHARQRQRLIEACISALHIYGPSRTTVEKVVAIAKMSPGIVRFYFDSKAAMLVASLQYLSAEFEERVLVPVARLKDNPVSALELMVDLYLDPDIASPRKVSVWYAFWGEASSRQEYYDICGQKDESFTVLVRDLIGRLVRSAGQPHLDADAVALGLIGVLEMLWQDFAFQHEDDIDRALAKRRALAYLRSVFPDDFPPTASTAPRPGSGVEVAAAAKPVQAGALTLDHEREALFRRGWLIAGHDCELPEAGDFITADTGAERVLVVRDEAGAVHALRNHCLERPHALVTAGRGHFARGIECALHGLAYALDGRQVEGGVRGDLKHLESSTEDGWILVRSAAGSADAAAAAVAAPGARPALGAAPARGGRPARQALRALGVGLETEVAADWKLVVEQWLEAAPADVMTANAATADARTLSWWMHAPASMRGFSARRYRSLAGKSAQEPWQMRFILPNQLIESRPDGISLWQAIPIERGRCRVRRFDYGAQAASDGGRVLPYLAGRIHPRGRRKELAVAESVQQALDRFGHEPQTAPPAHPAVAWLRRRWAEDLGARR